MINNRIRTVTVITASVVGLALIGSQPAAAVPPTTQNIDVTFDVQVADLCAFPVDIAGHYTGTERDYLDHAGQTVRADLHLVEQDRFTANGKTLTGDPFVNQQQLLFNSAGELVHEYEVGVIERVPLPDGGEFLSAGRVDFIAHPHTTVLITPDVGHAGDLAAFCAALLP
jgi:hypothetical protein